MISADINTISDRILRVNLDKPKHANTIIAYLVVLDHMGVCNLSNINTHNGNGYYTAYASLDDVSLFFYIDSQRGGKR